MLKLYAIDLDGTLFYPKHPRKILSNKTVNLLQRIVDSGDFFVAVSGRTLTSCKTVFTKIDREPHIIACNGSCILVKDELIFDKYFESETVHKILDYVHTNYKTIGCYVMDKDGRLILKNKFRTFMQRFGQKMYDLSRGNLLDKYIISEDSFNEAIKNNRVYKIMIMFGVFKKAKLRAKEANKDLQQKFGDICSSCWSEQMVEISPFGCDKSNGIKMVANHLGVKNEDIIVVGDSGNDIPMFKAFFENSYCISRAPSTVRKYAKHNVKNVNKLLEQAMGK